MADGLTPDLAELLDSLDNPATGFPGHNAANDLLQSNLSNQQRQHPSYGIVSHQLPTTGFNQTLDINSFGNFQQSSHNKQVLGLKDNLVEQNAAATEEASSLGSMFLTSVECMLSEDTPGFPLNVNSQPPPQAKQKQALKKDLNHSTNDRYAAPQHSPLQQNQQMPYRNQQQVFMNQTMNVVGGRNTCNQGNIQPFVAPKDNAEENISRSKNFARPNAQYKPPTPGQQPPRPSSSNYMTATQPSPANSNYSGDPPTPLSHHPGTPQSNRSITPQNIQTMQDPVMLQQQAMYPNELSNQSFHDQNIDLIDSSGGGNSLGRWGDPLQNTASLPRDDRRNLSSNSTSGYSSAYQSDSSVPSNNSSINTMQLPKGISENVYGGHGATYNIINDKNSSSTQSKVMNPANLHQDILPQQQYTMGGRSQVNTTQNIHTATQGTMNMMNVATNAVKNMLSSNPYEAISPVSDVASPPNKLQETYVPINENDGEKPEKSDSASDPVFVYLQSAAATTSQGYYQGDAAPYSSKTSDLSNNTLLYTHSEIDQQPQQRFVDNNLSSLNSDKRRTSTDRQGGRTRNPSNKSKARKKESIEEDFGFGSGEPTIRLSGEHLPSTALPQQVSMTGFGQVQQAPAVVASVPSQAFLSTKFVNSSLPLDSETQNSMQEIAQLQKQQKLMMLRLQEMQNKKKQEKVGSLPVKKNKPINGSFDNTLKNNVTDKTPIQHSIEQLNSQKATLQKYYDSPQTQSQYHRKQSQPTPNQQITTTAAFQHPKPTFQQKTSPVTSLPKTSPVSYQPKVSPVSNQRQASPAVFESKQNPPSSHSTHNPVVEKQHAKAPPVISSHASRSSVQGLPAIKPISENINTLKPSSSVPANNKPDMQSNYNSANILKHHLMSTNETSRLDPKLYAPPIQSKPVSTSSLKQESRHSSSVKPSSSIASVTKPSVAISVPNEVSSVAQSTPWNPMNLVDSSSHPIYLPQGYGNLPGAYPMGMPQNATGYAGMFHQMGYPSNVALSAINVPVTEKQTPSTSSNLTQSEFISANQEKPSISSPDRSKSSPKEAITSQSINISPVDKSVMDPRKSHFVPNSYPSESMQYIPPVMLSSLPQPSILSHMTSSPFTGSYPNMTAANNEKLNVSEMSNMNKQIMHNSTPSGKMYQESKINMQRKEQNKHSVDKMTKKHNISSAQNKQQSRVSSANKVTVPKTVSSSATKTTVSNSSAAQTSTTHTIKHQTTTSSVMVHSFGTSDTTYYGPKKQKLREASYLNAMSNPLPTVSTANTPNVPSKKHNVQDIITKTNMQFSTDNKISENLNANSHNNNAMKHLSSTTNSQSQISANSAAALREISKTRPDASNRKDTQNSGQMFSLFDSILQNAADALKTKRATESKGDETNLEMMDKPIEIPDKATVQTVEKPIKSVEKPKAIENIPEKPKQSVKHIQKLPELPKVAPVTKSITEKIKNTSNEIAKVPSINKHSKPPRPAAMFPFKRRPIPDPETFQASVVNSVIATTTSSLPTEKAIVCTASTTMKTDTTKLAISAKHKSVSAASVVKHKPTHTESKEKKANLKISNTTPTTASKPVVFETTATGESTRSSTPPCSTGIKLKITTFRSVGGKVIHQSSVLDKPSEDSGSERSYKKKSKKRKKKSKKKVTDSDCDSASSFNSASSYEPSSKIRKAEKLNLSTIAVLKNLNKTLEKNIAAAGPLTEEIIKKSKKNSKRKLESSDKESKSPSKKSKKDAVKTSEKVKPLRYKPKFAQSSITSTTSSVGSKNAVIQPPRTAGKVPSYLTSATSTILNSVPTIQLVVRNTTSVQDSITDAATSTTSKTPVTSKQPIHIKPGILHIVNPARSSATEIMNSLASTAKSTSKSIFPLNTSSTKTVTLNAVPISITSTAVTTQAKPALGTVVSPKIKLIIASSTVSIPKNVQVLSKPSLVPTRPTPVANITVAKPPPAVYKPGDYTSNFKVADGFQLSFLKLVYDKNPNKYTMPIPPSELNAGNHQRSKQQCMECGDAFMFKSSLEHHFERRSLCIKLCCVQCNQVMIFFNKCKFLSHAREHAQNNSPMQFTGGQMKPIPMTMCRPMSLDAYFSNDENEVDKYTLVPSAVAQKTRSACVLACTECNYCADSPTQLESHFQEQLPPKSPGRSHTCDMCHLNLYNDCSYFAHMRMHKLTAPHTCPECGQSFESAGNNFNSHLSVVCFHSCRISCFKCSICGEIFLSGETLKRHLEDKHVQIFYKCSECPMAFKNLTTIKSHNLETHGIAQDTAKTTKTIYKCPLCDTVFTDNSHSQQLYVLLKHFDTHLTQKKINITAYKCKACSKICEKKVLIREHLKYVHNFVSPGIEATKANIDNVWLAAEKNKTVKSAKQQVTKSMKTPTQMKENRSKSDSKPPPEPMDVEEGSDKEANDDMDSIRSISPVTSEAIGDSSNGFGDSPKKAARQPLKLRFKEMKLATSPVQQDSDSSLKPPPIGKMPDYKDINGKKVFVCPQCKQEFNTSKSRLNHVRLKHQGIRNMFCCPHCAANTVRFAKKISLAKHLAKVHSITSPKKSDISIVAMKVAPTEPGRKIDAKIISEDKINPQVLLHRESLPTSPRKKLTTCTNINESMPARLMRRKRESHESMDEDFSPENITEADFKFPDKYVCAKCHFESEDRNMFQDHIETHMDTDSHASVDSSLSQCTECGLCFASTASLAKHLFIKHKIKNHRKLEAFNRKNRAKYLESSASESNTSLNQLTFSCKVCYKRFDDDNLLRTHMRTHGLAFVKSKQPSS